jgi:hypothetical protein
MIDSIKFLTGSSSSTIQITEDLKDFLTVLARRLLLVFLIGGGVFLSIGQ